MQAGTFEAVHEWPTQSRSGLGEPIEEVEVGDRVWATDPETSEEGPRTVVATITSSGIKELVEVTVDIDGAGGDKTATVVATAEHPFWVDDQGRWLNANELTPGSDLRTVDGDRLEVLSLERRTESRRVHNLTINGIHTYHVRVGSDARAGAAESVVVHNSNCPGDKWTSESNLNDHFDRHGAEMGFDTPAEYRYAAEDLMCMCDGKRPGVLVKRDGDTSYFFDKETGGFGIASTKGIVTYYKPSGGIGHFNQQPGVIVP